MLTSYLNITQVDFVTAITYNPYTGVQSYQHAFFVRAQISADDLNDNFENATLFDPCSPNPCLNGASCSIGFANKYFCFCPVSYTGILKLLLKEYILNYI